MHRFFASNLKNTKRVVLSAEESLHAVKVLRLKEGESVELIDGQGTLVNGKIISNNKKDCVVEIEQVLEEITINPAQLTLAVAPTKSIDRFKFMVEKVTELGVHSIVPLRCTRSERKQLNIDKLNKVIQGAVKQSGRLFSPVLHPVTPFGKFVETPDGQGFIGTCADDLPLLQEQAQINQATTVLIGPEGDFTEEEVNLANKRGFLPISLGKTRLRVETAAIYVCSLFSKL